MSCRTWCRPRRRGPRPAGRAIRATSTTPSPHADRLGHERQRHAGREQERAQRRPGELVERDEAGISRALPIAEVLAPRPASAAGCAPRVSANTSASAEQEHRDEHDRDVDVDRSRWRARASAEHDARGAVGDHDHAAPVEPVGERPGVQAEQQPRQALQQRGQGDQERVVGSARRPAAGRRRGRCRRRGCSSTTTRAATGSCHRAGVARPGPRSPAPSRSRGREPRRPERPEACDFHAHVGVRREVREEGAPNLLSGGGALAVRSRWYGVATCWEPWSLGVAGGVSRDP